MPVDQDDQYCLLWIDWWATCLSKDEWASWVQAIGTLAAVFAAVGLAWWEFRERRLDSARTSAALLSARIHLVEKVIVSLEEYLGCYKVPDHFDFDRTLICLQRLQGSVHKVNNIDLAEMPTRASVQHLKAFQTAASSVYERLPVQGRVSIKASLVKELHGELYALKVHLNFLHSEADRLAR